MRVLFVAIFISLTSGCSHNGLRFIHDGSIEHKTSTAEKAERSDYEQPSNGSYITSDVPLSPKIDEPVPIEADKVDRWVDRLSNMEEEVFDQQKLTEPIRAVNNRREKGSKKEDQVLIGGSTVMFVIGGILLIVALVNLVKYLSTPEDPSTVGGCLTTVFGMIAYMTLAIIFGALAAVFILVGVLLLILAKKSVE